MHNEQSVTTYKDRKWYVWGSVVEHASDHKQEAVDQEVLCQTVAHIDPSPAK